MKEAGGDSSKTTGAETDNATTISVAKETNTFSAGNNRACSDGGSREDECGDGMATAENRVGTMQLICHRGGQGEELLCLWRIWAHGLPLQKSGRKENNGRENNRTEKGKVREQHGTD